MDGAPTSYANTLADAPAWLVADLRSDQAGETGAVYIYRGILAVSRDAMVRAFAQEHLQTEQQHLEEIDELMPPGSRSRLLPAWRLAGWVTGALPALFGRRAVFATIEAVETFVDAHYTEQIDALETEPRFAWLREVMIRLRADEIHHRDDAAGRLETPPGPVLKAWAWTVGFGSSSAVKLARRL